MARIKPFSRTEKKILVYNKVKRGMSYEQACKEVEKEISECIKNSKVEKDDKPTFKEEFEKLRNGEQR